MRWKSRVANTGPGDIKFDNTHPDPHIVLVKRYVQESHPFSFKLFFYLLLKGNSFPAMSVYMYQCSLDHIYIFKLRLFFACIDYFLYTSFTDHYSDFLLSAILFTRFFGFQVIIFL